MNSGQPPPKKSGEHPAVVGMRKKFQSISETTIPFVEALRERVTKSNPPIEEDTLIMGNWHMLIDGVGVHHNKKLAADANRLLAKFVEDLKAAGHSISSARFTHGGADDVTDPTHYIKERDDFEAR